MPWNSFVFLSRKVVLAWLRLRRQLLEACIPLLWGLLAGMLSENLVNNIGGGAGAGRRPAGPEGEDLLQALGWAHHDCSVACQLPDALQRILRAHKHQEAWRDPRQAGPRRGGGLKMPIINDYQDRFLPSVAAVD